MDASEIVIIFTTLKHTEHYDSTSLSNVCEEELLMRSNAAFRGIEIVKKFRR